MYIIHINSFDFFYLNVNKKMISCYLQLSNKFWPKNFVQIFGNIDDERDSCLPQKVDVQGDLVTSDKEARVRIPLRRPNTTWHWNWTEQLVSYRHSNHVISVILG